MKDNTGYLTLKGETGQKYISSAESAVLWTKYFRINVRPIYGVIIQQKRKFNL